MARIRSLKIGFFLNDTLCALSPWHRLLFEGLWLLADREGRLEDRPRRIWAKLFPYDELDLEPMLSDLVTAGFIQRYEIHGTKCIGLPNFHRHQLIGRDEPASELPGQDGEMTAYERPPNETIRAQIYQRDEFRCVYCQRDMAKTPRLRCVDHVVPYGRGGTHNQRNLVTACKMCNAKKQCRTPLEAEMPWPQGFGDQLTVSQHPVNGSRQDREGERDLGIGNGKGQREEEAADGAAGADAAPSSRNRADDFADLWNTETKPPIARCRDLTTKRRRQIRSRLTEYPLTEWGAVFRRIQASAFCRGENDRGWRASFDWVIGSPDVGVKVLEGKYDDRQTSGVNKNTAGVIAALKEDVRYD